MTKEQQQTIERLRNMGLGYRKIGIALDLPRDKVRNYCKKTSSSQRRKANGSSLCWQCMQTMWQAIREEIRRTKTDLLFWWMSQIMGENPSVSLQAWVYVLRKRIWEPNEKSEVLQPWLLYSQSVLAAGGYRRNYETDPCREESSDGSQVAQRHTQWRNKMSNSFAEVYGWGCASRKGVKTAKKRWKSSGGVNWKNAILSGKSRG